MNIIIEMREKNLIIKTKRMVLKGRYLLYFEKQSTKQQLKQEQRIKQGMKRLWEKNDNRFVVRVQKLLSVPSLK